MTSFLLLLALVPRSPAAPSWPDLSTPPPPTGGGELDAAVLVGIDDYSVLPDVPGAVVNIADWQAWLVGTRGLRPVAVETLRDGDAVDVTILESVREAVARVQPGGVLWLVYAGHGAPSDEGAEPLLVGADAQPTVSGIRSRSVPLSELEALLALGKQAHTVLVLDACFSGQGVDGRELVVEPLAPARGVPERPAPAGMTVLTATSANQYAGLLPGAGRPAFSYLVLGALRGWGDESGDGVVTAQEAGDYATGALKLLLSGRRQEPRVSGDGAIALSSGGEAGPDLLALSRPSSLAALGETEVKLGGNTDFARASVVARAKEEEARRALEEAARAMAAAEAARRRQLEVAKSAIQAKAALDWASVRTLLTPGAGAETAAVIESFIRQYEGATVGVDGVTEAVEVPELALATAALADVQRRVGDEAVAVRQQREVAGDAAASAQQDSERPMASVASKSRSARVPLIATGALAGVGGGVLLLAGELTKQQALDWAATGAADEDSAEGQQTVVNTMFGAGYGAIGLGLVLGGVAFAVPVDGTVGVVVSARW